MTTLSITINRRHLQSGGQLSIHLKQGNRVNYFDIAATGMDDYQLTLLGIIIALKPISHGEPLTITTDNEVVATTGQWIISDVDCDMVKEDVAAWNQHREVWQRLFSILPESVSFHYRSDRPKHARRGVARDTAMEIVELVTEICPGGTVVVFSSSNGGKR